MARPAARPRHLPDRARVQPAGRRPARRVRSAALLVLTALAACGRAPAPARATAEDYHRRFLERRWDDLAAWDAEAGVAGLQRYVESDDAEYPPEDPRFEALHQALFRLRPPPAALLPLLGPDPRPELDAHARKRDKVARMVLWSLMRRLVDVPADPDRAGLWDGLVVASIHFSFDARYEDSHTLCGEDLAEFFTEPEVAAEPASAAAFERHLEPLLAAWRARVTTKASSVFFGTLMRHLGRLGADRLFSEWERMDGDERYDLVVRARDEDELGRASRVRLVEVLLDDSPELRKAARRALEAHGAPVSGYDPSEREEARRAPLEELRRWAAETRP